MRAALLGEYHRPLQLVDRPEPEPSGPRSVVVRIGGAGVCATDLHAIDGEMEPAGLRLPIVLGHENAGWEVLQLHAAGAVALRSESHPLEEVNDVLDKLRAGEVTGRAVLVP